MCMLMLWNPELEDWYQVDPQSIPEDRSFLRFCDTYQTQKSSPLKTSPDYYEYGASIGIPHTLDTLCPKCQELISLVPGNQDTCKKYASNL